MLVWSLIVDSIAALFTTLFMIAMKVPTKGSLVSVFHNLSFWLYAGYWLKTVMVLVRTPIFHLDLLDHNLVSLGFNWAGCLIVTISTVVPFQWVYHFAKSPYGLIQLPAHDRYRFCLCVVSTFAALIAFSIILLTTNIVTSSQILFAWRVVFFFCATTEVTLLSWSLLLIRKVDTNEQRWARLRVHLACTLFTRSGIATTVVLRIFGYLPKWIIAVTHLFFVLVGMFINRFGTATKSRTPERVLVCQTDEDSAVILFNVIAKRLSERTDTGSVSRTRSVCSDSYCEQPSSSTEIDLNQITWADIRTRMSETTPE
eukprot:c8886_g1_i1.p1 GENE.c8886_g1_i1~~c8886_g1_i1.p1  ORF type:complete len:324 (+),score=42.33 c8886_g1_i1:33-974(+)